MFPFRSLSGSVDLLRFGSRASGDDDECSDRCPSSRVTMDFLIMGRPLPLSFPFLMFVAPVVTISLGSDLSRLSVSFIGSMFRAFVLSGFVFSTFITYYTFVPVVFG